MRKLLVLVAFLAFQSVQAEIGSVYTNIKEDCLDVSVPTELAPIDFYDAACKSFGGYNLTISGGDIRYSPRLSFGAKEIALINPYSFHDLGSDKIEWVYNLSRDSEGSGTLVWKALIYRLNVQNNEAMKDESILYVVRLDGENTCSLGTAKTNEEARDLALSKVACQTRQE